MVSLNSFYFLLAFALLPLADRLPLKILLKSFALLLSVKVINHKHIGTGNRLIFSNLLFIIRLGFILNFCTLPTMNALLTFTPNAFLAILPDGLFLNVA